MDIYIMEIKKLINKKLKILIIYNKMEQIKEKL